MAEGSGTASALLNIRKSLPATHPSHADKNRFPGVLYLGDGRLNQPQLLALGLFRVILETEMGNF